MVDLREKPPSPCPKCASADVVQIVWGLPTSATIKAASEGLVHLGGCCVTSESPKWLCRSCQHRWGRAFAKAGEVADFEPFQ